MNNEINSLAWIQELEGLTFVSAVKKMRNCNSLIRFPGRQVTSPFWVMCHMYLRGRTSWWVCRPITSPTFKQNSVNLSDKVLVVTVLMFANQSISLYLLGTPSPRLRGACKITKSICIQFKNMQVWRDTFKVCSRRDIASVTRHWVPDPWAGKTEGLLCHGK